MEGIRCLVVSDYNTTMLCFHTSSIEHCSGSEYLHVSLGKGLGLTNSTTAQHGAIRVNGKKRELYFMVHISSNGITDDKIVFVTLRQSIFNLANGGEIS